MRSNKRLFIVAPALAALLAVLTLGVVLAQTSVLGGKVVAGAKEGTYRACLLPPPVEGGKPPPLVIPERYTRFETSNLQFDIRPGPNTITIEVERGTR